MEAKRLNKFISDTGFCSRREADKLLEQGRVTVNGKIPEPGTKVTAKDKVRIDDELLHVREEEIVFLLFNKPAGIATTTDLSVRNNIISALNYPASLLPIGFLDREAEGLLFLSNDTEQVRKMTKNDAKYEKEYIVTVDKLISGDFLTKVSEGGIPEPGATRKKNFVAKMGTNRFRIVLEPSTNHHIKRIVEALGYKVVHLQRTRINNFTAGKLQVGMWRTLTEAEINEIKSVVAGKARSKNLTTGRDDDFYEEDFSSARPKFKPKTGNNGPGKPATAAKNAGNKTRSKSPAKTSSGPRIGKSKPTANRNAAPRSNGRRGGSPKR
ncbi:MAG: S4 domain-containing protein [Bacteroidota bacterium]|nr:S4 domain-containing protein [Bacteroidota bacterium]